MQSLTIKKPKFFQQKLTSFQDLIEINKTLLFIFNNYYRSSAYQKIDKDRQEMIFYMQEILSDLLSESVMKGDLKNIELTGEFLDIIRCQDDLDLAKQCLSEVVNNSLQDTEKYTISELFKDAALSLQRSTNTILDAGRLKVLRLNQT